MTTPEYDYVLFVDEAGDDKLKRLKPVNKDGNSEWLCLGGYLINANHEANLEARRDELLYEIGSSPGGVLHFKKYNAKNQNKLCVKISQFSARAFVICSFKQTMVGYRNPRAEAAATASSGNQFYFNFLIRLLLERVTEFVENDSANKGISSPKLKIVVASRKGHHFGHFKAYIGQLKAQAIGHSTFLDTQEVAPNVLLRELVVREVAANSPGLQLADVIVSATFQSIDQASKNYASKPAKLLRPILARNPRIKGPVRKSCNFGMTLFHPTQAPPLLNGDQKEFFAHFGYRHE